MQRGNILPVRVPSASLSFALTHGGNPSAMINFTMPAGIGAGGHARARISEIRLWATSAIKYGIRFFATAAGGDSATIDNVKYLGEWCFGNSAQPGDGGAVVGDNQKYYYVPDLDISYRDDDMGGKLHFQVINFDAAVDKAAAANLVIEFGLEPTQGI